MDKYTTLRILIDTGAIVNLRDILDHIAIETLAADLGEDTGYLEDLFNNTKNISMGEINQWSELIDCDIEKMFGLVINQHRADLGQ